MARASDQLFDDGLKVDMSPMIDLVFLLLVFFMTSSTMITIRKDQRVTVPIASSAEVPKLVTDRIIVNILMDGTCYDESGKDRLSLDRIQSMARSAKSKHAQPKLLLRADQAVPHRLVKRVIDASRAGGVTNVIFSTYVTDK